MLLEVKEEEEEEGGKEGEQEERSQKPKKDANPYLVVHPNYVVET